MLLVEILLGPWSSLRTQSIMSYLHFREGDPRDFDTSFKGVELINIFIKEGAKFIEGAKIQGWGGNWTIFMAPRIPFFIISEHFCLASKIKIEFIEAKHQTLYKILWLQLYRFKDYFMKHIFKDLLRSLEVFKTKRSLKIFILSFKDLCCFLLWWIH